MGLEFLRWSRLGEEPRTQGSAGSQDCKDSAVDVLSL